METSISGHNVAVVRAQTHRLELGPIGTCNSCANFAVLYAKNHRRLLGPIEICNSGHKVAVLNAITTNEGWDP